eukprot:CAMPEP_0178966030 /NCGR_PEP_ID=MMETSP0789-20121207/16681_1 /TAXON_ID=3005 /ORGANISM="Rhizosolenia setigera, Strain CCMP 1694" /LENGTH=36 /DNA_ID= /DNA_START= /DNA_END= /DNA_ORIENTATION=
MDLSLGGDEAQKKESDDSNDDGSVEDRARQYQEYLI